MKDTSTITPLPGFPTHAVFLPTMMWMDVDIQVVNGTSTKLSLQSVHANELHQSIRLKSQSTFMIKLNFNPTIQTGKTNQHA